MFLLHGVTGSGKTLVYIELLREIVMKRGQTAIVLVPEIALTPQTVDRFRAVFGDEVAVLHSALSDGERYDAWLALRRGEKRIAVGARSAIFAPLANLGAIIVDEEHEGSYKQGETPRYHAREVAIVRARAEGAVVVLGSATPRLESWANAAQGKYTLLVAAGARGRGEAADASKWWICGTASARWASEPVDPARVPFNSCSASRSRPRSASGCSAASRASCCSTVAATRRSCSATRAALCAAARTAASRSRIIARPSG